MVVHAGAKPEDELLSIGKQGQLGFLEREERGAILIGAVVVNPSNRHAARLEGGRRERHSVRLNLMGRAQSPNSPPLGWPP